MGGENKEINGSFKYLDKHNLEKIRQFDEFRTRYSYQFARFYLGEDFIKDSLSIAGLVGTKIQRENWCKELTGEEELNFYKGWKQYIIHQKFAYHDCLVNLEGSLIEAGSQGTEHTDLMKYNYKTKIDQCLFEIEYVEGKIIELEKTVFPEEFEYLTKEIQQRVAWMYAIGLVDAIHEKHGIESKNAIGKILSYGMGRLEVEYPDQLRDAIRKTLERIETHGLLSKYNDYIDQKCKELGIIRVN